MKPNDVSDLTIYQLFALHSRIPVSSETAKALPNTNADYAARAQALGLKVPGM